MRKFLNRVEEKTKKIGGSLQESFGESSEKKYSDEEKQKELANLHKLIEKSENILDDWKNGNDEVAETIQKLKEYRDNKSVIWENYNSYTKNAENPNGLATSLLSNLKAKSKKAKESIWGFEKFQEVKFATKKGEKNKEAERTEKMLSGSEVEKRGESAMIKNEEVSKVEKDKIKTASKSFSTKGIRDSLEVRASIIKDSLVGEVEGGGKWISEKYESIEKTIIRELKISNIWEELKKKMKQHELGKEENIELKYRINEIQTKPEARLWLAHLLLPIHGKRVQIEVLNTDKLEREIQELKTEIESLKKNDSSSSEFQEKQQKLERLERTCRCRFYDGANQKIELVELAELGSIKSGKILHGVIVTKKSGDSSRRRKFFKLEERYDSEKELYEDTYHILWRSLIKGGVDKLTIDESRMERILTDRIASDLTSLNFLGFKKETVRVFASGLAKTSQAISVAKWVTNNSFLILIDLLNRWDSYLLGNVDTPPAFNIRTAFSYSLIYETKIVEKWEEEFEKACYELEDRSAELGIVELPKYTYEQKKKITQKIVRKLFNKYRKEVKERGSGLSKINNKFWKFFDKEDDKFLEIIDRNLEGLIIETWEERGTRKLRSELNRKFSSETFGETLDEELEVLHREEIYILNQIERLEELNKKNKEERWESELEGFKIELEDRQNKIRQLEELLKKEVQLVAQIEVK